MNESATHTEFVGPKIAVQKVSISQFFVNELVHQAGKQELTLSINQKSSFDGDTNIAKIYLSFTYSYKETEVKVSEITVMNAFIIEELKSYLYKNDSSKIILPRPTLVILVSIALSHTRALFSHSIAGTLFAEEMPLVIFDPVAVANVIFPEIKPTIRKTRKIKENKQ